PGSGEPGGNKAAVASLPRNAVSSGELGVAGSGVLPKKEANKPIRWTRKLVPPGGRQQSLAGGASQATVRRVSPLQQPTSVRRWKYFPISVRRFSRHHVLGWAHPSWRRALRNTVGELQPRRTPKIRGVWIRPLGKS